MTTITDEYPVIREFGPGACTCATRGQRGTGCAVCSTAQLLLRWGLAIPRTSTGHPDMVSLGKSMGRRHRAVNSSCRHGLSLVPGEACAGGYWCAYCAYLELKARGVAVAYGKLTLTQIRAQLDAHRPIILPGDYWQVPVVSRSSFDSTTPAHGRVQVRLSTKPFGHMVTAWHSIQVPREGRVAYAVSDPDFGSVDANAVPSHSVWADSVLEKFWGAYKWAVCYSLLTPPRVGEPPAPPAAGTILKKQWGAVEASRGSYLIPKGVRVRRDPHVVNGNIFRTIAKPTTFAAAQVAYGGTNVKVNGVGTSLWLGNRRGDLWVLKELTTLVGHTTGEEDLR